MEYTSLNMFLLIFTHYLPSQDLWTSISGWDLAKNWLKIKDFRQNGRLKVNYADLHRLEYIMMMVYTFLNMFLLIFTR